MAEAHRLAAGYGQHRRTMQVGILHAGREIGCSDRLREADAGLCRYPGISVSHVGRSLFAMGQNAADTERLQLYQRPPQYCIHEEDVADAAALKIFGYVSIAGDFSGHAVLVSAGWAARRRFSICSNRATGGQAS